MKALPVLQYHLCDEAYIRSLEDAVNRTVRYIPDNEVAFVNDVCKAIQQWTSQYLNYL